MKRALALLLVLLLPAAFAAADAAAAIAQADALHDAGKYAEAKAALAAAVDAAAAKEKAELYWRMSRETKELGDVAEDQKKPANDLLAIFVEGEGLADKAIAADAQNAMGFYWKASNIGRWGQVKGILNSLFKAGPMRDQLVKAIGVNADLSDAYSVLGQLYRELPGAPLSFGNIDFAVSLGRKAVDLRAAQVAAGKEKAVNADFLNQLAKNLWKRNWSADKRAASQAAKTQKLAAAATPLDKGCFHEGSVTLKAMSDREEALAILRQVLADLSKLSSPTAGQQGDLTYAQDLLREYAK